MPIKPVSGKIESQEINDNFSYLESLAKKESGLAPGVYETLGNLKDTYPNGNNKIYVVKSDGNWYYYDDSWKVGGRYIDADVLDALTEEGEKWVI